MRASHALLINFMILCGFVFFVGGCFCLECDMGRQVLVFALRFKHDPRSMVKARVGVPDFLCGKFLLGYAALALYKTRYGENQST